MLKRHLFIIIIKKKKNQQHRFTVLFILFVLPSLHAVNTYMTCMPEEIYYLLYVASLSCRASQAQANHVHEQTRNAQQVHGITDEGRGNDVVNKESPIVGKKYTPEGKRGKTFHTLTPIWNWKSADAEISNDTTDNNSILIQSHIKLWLLLCYKYNIPMVHGSLYMLMHELTRISLWQYPGTSDRKASEKTHPNYSRKRMRIEHITKMPAHSLIIKIL